MACVYCICVDDLRNPKRDPFSFDHARRVLETRFMNHGLQFRNYIYT